MESKLLPVCYVARQIMLFYSNFISEYLYRVTVESESGAIVPSNWIVVRTGEDGIEFEFFLELYYRNSLVF